MANKFSIKTAIGLLVVLILGLGGIYIAFQVSQTNKKLDTRSKAANTANAELTFDKISDNTAEINIVPGDHKVTAVQLALKYDPAKIKINSLTNSTRFSNVLQSTFIDNVNGTASAVFSPITMADLSALQPGQTAEDLTLRLNAKVADVNFQLLSNDGASINFDTETIVTSYNEDNNVLKTPTTPPIITAIPTNSPTLTPTLTPVPTSSQTTTLFLTIPNDKIAPETQFTVDAQVDPAGNSIGAVVLHLTFDPSRLEIIDAIPQPAFPEIVENLVKDNVLGKASYVAGIGTTMPLVTTRTTAAKFTFKTKALEGQTTINFNQDKTKALEANNSLARNVLANANGIPITVEKPTSATTVKILLRKMENTNKVNIPVKVTLANSAGVSILSDIYNFKPVTEGDKTYYVYTFSGLPVTSQAKVVLKPKNYLSNKFNSDLTAGNNILDYSSAPFYGGDITGETGEEDNSVDISDYTMLVSHFGPRMPAGGSSADISRDGNVSPTDYSELIGNYGKTGVN